MTDGDGNYELPWGPLNDTVGAKANFMTFGQKLVTAGEINTRILRKRYGTGSGYAAGACVNYSHDINGKTYNGWNLPTSDQLELMMAMQQTINSISEAHGGTAIESDVYWSSFEESNYEASTQSFLDASQTGYSKDDTYRVRAVRAF
ncbi:MAG: DUF1566 domain-containing protein [Alphaproteobacteria bacterium]|nr:DUF1566 domain-containing protein [Alphaproteobacteria bacterium]